MSAFASTPIKLGILGGTFDPVHAGHLHVAEQAKGALDLDGVVLVPAGDPWMKSGSVVASGRDRMAMVQRAVAHLNAHEEPESRASLLAPCFSGQGPYFASDIEVRRSGQTYTVDTLRELRDLCPQGTQLYLLVGSDAALAFDQWRSPQEICQLARVVVIARPGCILNDFERQRIEDRVGAAFFDQMEIGALDLSSTELRRALSRPGTDGAFGVDGFEEALVPEVLDYIRSHGLYY